MEKREIKNRNDQRISVIIDEAQISRGLAFIMHGLGGYKEQDQIRAVAEVFHEHGFTTIRFDTTNTLGESDGAYENATVTNYYEDLEDVIRWAAVQSWFRQPFALVGHSIGALCISLFAQNHPEMILALAPVSPVVNGRLSLEARENRDPVGTTRWKELGWLEEPSHSKPGVMKRLPWFHMENRFKYDIIKDAAKLTMPTLVVVGERDVTTPVEHVRMFFDALPGKKKVMHIIRGAPHTFRDPAHLAQLRDIFVQWTKSLFA